MCESYTETTTIALSEFSDNWRIPTAELLDAHFEYCDKALRDHSDEIIEAAILLYRKRFPDDERQPVRELCYMDDCSGIVLCDTEYKLGAYFVGISDDENSHVTLEFDFAKIIDTQIEQNDSSELTDELKYKKIEKINHRLRALLEEQERNSTERKELFAAMPAPEDIPYLQLTGIHMVCDYFEKTRPLKKRFLEIAREGEKLKERFERIVAQG